ncbi:acyltransferase [Candidatus Saccharibacteria bacterium]|nr:acyltransferase [Candidatus Saccharibacteria bacterium]
MITRTIRRDITQEKQHNTTIAIWKFLFSLLILWRHAEVYNPIFANSHFNFIGGSIAIFFFFIVSGYLMTVKALSMPTDNLGKSTFSYIGKKIIRFLPFIIVAETASIIVYVINGGQLNLPVILNSFFDFTIVPQIFITHQKFLGIAWYISAMLVGMLILYPLIVKYKKNFLYLISPLIALFAFSFMNKMDGGSYASADVYYFNFLPKGLIAALGGLSLGSLSYLLASKIQSINFSRFSKIALTFIYVFFFCSIFFLSCDSRSHYFYDSIMVVLLFTGISIAFSNISVTQKLTNNRIVLYLEKLSLPLYLNQMWVMTIVHSLFPNIDKFYIFIAISTIMTILISILTIYLTGFLTKVFQENKLKKDSFAKLASIVFKTI